MATHFGGSDGADTVDLGVLPGRVVDADGDLDGEDRYVELDGGAAPVTVALDPAPRDGQIVTLKAVDITNTVKISGADIEGVAGDYLFANDGDTLSLRWSESAATWRVYYSSNPLYPNSRQADHTVWDDVSASLTGLRLLSTSGAVDFDWDENAVIFQSGSISSQNDRVIWSRQFPHAAKVDSSIKLHMHVEQDRTDAVVFTVQWRIQKNNAPKTTAWQTATANLSTEGIYVYPGSGTFNQVLPLADIDMTDAGISATIDFRLARTDSLGGNVAVKFVDFHVEYDSAGSRLEFVK